nr:unnamed protein product [Digitaria exilis]
MAVAFSNPVLSPLVPAAPGRRGRASFARSRAASLGPIACGAVVGRVGWHLAAAAAESQAVQEQTEVSGETGAAGAPEASSKLVLVVGGTGGVGQLVVASLLNRNIKSRLLLRDPEKAVSLFGKHDENVLQHFHQSAGMEITLQNAIMNLFGVLKYKKMGEDFVRSSGIPFTIIRPGRLTDGPYTSYDLNTLLKATAGERRAVVIGKGDKLVGEVSRLVVAEACIQALDIESTEGQIYEINSVKGEGPGTDPEKWKDLFSSVQST